ncbi:DsrE/DsrF/DrsH-like family protein [Altericista sp. CCNU0014]|uniref:DsrE/DsrF/DrsH-like family protein n=1 Tax=Altericista sp. CCNU0014 TaxID=3082949 RepID=UPI00384EC0A8
MERLAIVVRDDAYDRLYTPLTFAYVAAKKGIEVNMLFVLWAVRVLTEKGAKALKIDPLHATKAEWFKERLQHDGDPLEIYDFIKFVKQTGNVHFYGCKLAAATFDVTTSQLIPEADGIVDALWFLEEKAIKADHCQYF